MRYPVENFKTEWNTTAGFGFGDKTSYGYHDGVDINDNGGGNSDLGKSLFAIADGIITSVHFHSTKPTFGNHLHLKIEGDWGIRFVHYAHCQDIFVVEGQEVKEGQRIATVGNSGTDWAHCHFALKKEPTGIDGIATNLDLLKKWEDPIKFIEDWFSVIIPQPIPQDPNTNIEAELDHIYFGLTDAHISQDELKFRLDQINNQGKKMWDIINDIGFGDERFYNKFVKPKIPATDYGEAIADIPLIGYRLLVLKRKD